jgi:hypothetical protein
MDWKTPDTAPTKVWLQKQRARFNLEPADPSSAAGLHVRWYDDQNEVNISTMRY